MKDAVKGLDPVLFLEALAEAVRADLPYEAIGRRPRLSGHDLIPASVLVAIAWGAAGPCVLVTRRTDRVETHKGQMAFPGGQRDPEDLTPVSTALREAREEVGIEIDDFQVVGVLPELPTVTGFRVTPVVAFSKVPLEKIVLVPAPEEIDAMIWAPLSKLLEVYRRELLLHEGVHYPIEVFEVDGHRIWGVTGTLLKNLLDRMERLG